MRWPLDHIFFSEEFRLDRLKRMGFIGSDHFPMLIELSYEPEAVGEQEAAPPRPAHDRDAEEMIERAEASPGRAGASSGR